MNGFSALMLKRCAMLKSIITIISFSLLSFSCTAVFVEKPMPQGGIELYKIPIEWSGVFEVKTSDEDEYAAFIKNYLRFERLSDSKLFISAESRLPKKDLPNLDAYLAQKKVEGQSIDYQITDRFILFQVKSEQKNGFTSIETRAARIVDEGEWYVFTEASKPYMTLDLSSKTAIVYDQDNSPNRNDLIFPNSDSLVSQEKPIVLRQKGQSWYLNIQEAEANKWSCFVITVPAKDEFKIMLNILQDSESFENRLHYFKTILPIESRDRNYYINPSDEAFERFLAEPIFETLNLKKVKH